jgi:hypothetical protein
VHLWRSYSRSVVSPAELHNTSVSDNKLSSSDLRF